MEIRNALDRLLEYKINNEVGASFSLSRNETTGFLVLKLLSKTGNIIDQVELEDINGEDATNKPIISIAINEEDKTLVLTYYDNSTVSCDISELLDTYSTSEITTLLNAKQDKITVLNKLSSSLISDIDYDDLINKPSIPTKLSDLAEDSTHRTVTDTEIETWNSKTDFDGDYNSLINTPTIPTKLSELEGDYLHRTITDTERRIWSEKWSYKNLEDKPTLADIESDTEHRTVSDEEKEKYEAAYNHSLEDHAPANAEENLIDSVSLNGKTLAIDENKNIDIPAKIVGKTVTIDEVELTVPTNISEFENDSKYLVGSNILVDGDLTKTLITAEDGSETNSFTLSVTLPTNVSELTNDANYATKDELSAGDKAVKDDLTAILEKKLEASNIKAGDKVSLTVEGNDVTISIPTNVGAFTNDANYEVTANKVTEITVDSTDVQYPSAKAVYTKLTNLETTLSTDIAAVKTDASTDLATAVGELTTSIDTVSSRVEEVNTDLSNKIETINTTIATAQADITSLETSVESINSTLTTKQDTLPTSYIEYLKKQTFQTPVISTFQILNSSGTSVAGTYELGTSVTVSQIKHSETNIDNINGSLTFNGTDTITPVYTDTIIDTTDVSVSASKTFYLTGTDTMEGSISKSATITFNRYAYSNITSSTTTPTSGTRQSAISTFASSGASFTYAVGDYIYLYTTNSGKTIQTYVLGQWADVDTESLGAVTFTQSNDTTYTYYAYRTGPFIAAGSATYRI